MKSKRGKEKAKLTYYDTSSRFGLIIEHTDGTGVSTYLTRTALTSLVKQASKFGIHDFRKYPLQVQIKGERQ